MTAKKCPSCGKERCPGIVMRLDCPALKAKDVTTFDVEAFAKEGRFFTIPPVNGSVVVGLDVPFIGIEEQLRVTTTVTTKLGKGWRLIGDKPMTPAERQQRHRGKA